MKDFISKASPLKYLLPKVEIPVEAVTTSKIEFEE